MICKECKRDFPEELNSPMITSEGTKSGQCPICMLMERNKILGVSKYETFTGSMASELFIECCKHYGAKGMLLEDEKNLMLKHIKEKEAEEDSESEFVENAQVVERISEIIKKEDYLQVGDFKVLKINDCGEEDCDCGWNITIGHPDQREVSKFIHTLQSFDDVVLNQEKVEIILTHVVEDLYNSFKDNFIDYDQKTHRLGQFKEQVKIRFSQALNKLV